LGAVEVRRSAGRPVRPAPVLALGPAEGDLEAEGAELADVVGDLPADAVLAVVVVRSEILIACGSVTMLDSLTAADSSSFSARCFSLVRSAVRSHDRTCMICGWQHDMRVAAWCPLLCIG
jgi:hypothetical protein